MPFDGRILVTGGAGFIGSALVWALNQRGHDDILVADFMRTGEKWRNLAPLRFFDYVEGDRLRHMVAHEAYKLREVRLVLHMGACSSTTQTDVAYLMDNNYQFSKELAEWAMPRRVRLVYASSAATYGVGLPEGMPDTLAVLPSLRPLNAYGYSKHLFDVHAHRRGWLEHAVGLKFFNVFGPNEAHKGDMRSLVDKAFHQIRSTGRMGLFKSYRPEYADGQQRRDFLYVKDAADMVLFLAAHPQARGLYNLGSGQASTWLELAGAIFAALGKSPQVFFLDMPPELRERYQYHTQADLGRLHELGYARPLTPLAEAVADYVQNYLAPGKHLGD